MANDPKAKPDAPQQVTVVKTDRQMSTVRFSPCGKFMAAAGRDSFDDLRATGSLRIEGPEGPATALLTKLHIV